MKQRSFTLFRRKSRETCKHTKATLPTDGSAFVDSVRLNLNVHACEFIEVQQKKNSDQLTHSLQNQIDLSAPRPYPMISDETSTRLPCQMSLLINHPPIMPLDLLQRRPPKTFLLEWYTSPQACPFSLHNLCHALLHLHDPSRMPPYVALNATRSDTCSPTVPNISVPIVGNGPLDTIRKIAWSVQFACKILELIMHKDKQLNNKPLRLIAHLLPLLVMMKN
jgi:hypothetical protein